MKRLPVLVLVLLGLAACREETAEAPAPVELTQEALSYFCQMNIAEHGGPKGQIHLDGHPAPIFFAQVRDLVAYIKSPERDAEITAIYVSDMGIAPNWEQPGIDNWVTADEVVFVVGANVAGGMGAPEVVPFAQVEDASAFVATYGGRALTLADIPDEAVLGPVDLDQKLETPA